MIRQKLLTVKNKYNGLKILFVLTFGKENKMSESEIKRIC